MAMVTAESPAHSGAGPPSGVFSLRDILVQAFYNSGVIIACILAGLLIGLAAASLAKTQYTASSLLLVLPEPSNVLAPPAPAGPAADAEMTRAIQSDVQILQSDVVVQGAVQRLGVQALPGALPPFLHRRPPTLSDAMETFKRDLHVSVDTGSNIIRLTFASPDRQVSIRALQALIDAFGDQRAALADNAASGPQGGALQRYGAELSRIDAQMQKIEAAHGVIDIGQDTQLANTRLDGLSQRLSQARERMAAVEAELGATSSGLASTPAQVFASRDATNNTANDDSRNTLLRLRQDRAHLAAQYTDSWPAVRELDAKIAAAQAQRDRNAQDKFFTDRTVRNPVVDQLDSRLSNLKIERQSLAPQIAELEQESAQATARAAELRDVGAQLRELQRQRDVADGIYKQLSTNQAGAVLEDQTLDSRGGAFRVAQPPSAPMKGHSLRMAFLLGGLLLGIVLAIVAAGMATMGRQVFITPGEASRALRLPVLAHFDVKSSNFRSREGKAAVARFATLLVDATVEGRLLKVIQFVSTELDDKSDFALDLGQAIAADQSQRTLLIDFDAEARYRKLAGKSKAVRTLAAARHQITVARSATPGLWLTLDARNSPFGDPRLPLADVQASLDAIKPHFDRILIVAQRDVGQYAARRLYPLADANVLLVRAERTRSPAARQLKEVVLAAGGDILGIVFTHRGYYVPEALYRWL